MEEPKTCSGGSKEWNHSMET